MFQNPFKSGGEIKNTRFDEKLYSTAIARVSHNNVEDLHNQISTLKFFLIFITFFNI